MRRVEVRRVEVRLPQSTRGCMQTSERTSRDLRREFGEQRLVLSDQLQHQQLDQSCTCSTSEWNTPNDHLNDVSLPDIF